MLALFSELIRRRHFRWLIAAFDGFRYAAMLERRQPIFLLYSRFLLRYFLLLRWLSPFSAFAAFDASFRRFSPLFDSRFSRIIFFRCLLPLLPLAAAGFFDSFAATPLIFDAAYADAAIRFELRH